MSNSYTAASFTKNFGWNESYEKLHLAIRNGFSAGLLPTPRDEWRKHSKIGDSDRELIPLNFFLYTAHGLNEDFVLVDRLVERAMTKYDADYARLALFAFNLANSGTWRRSKWHSGKVAGWANEFIRTVIWKGGHWTHGVNIDAALRSFIKDRIVGEKVTKRKVFTNYRYMLVSAGALVDGKLRQLETHQPWPIYATQLFWDRQIFDGALRVSSGTKEFESVFLEHEIYKLLDCDLEQGRAFVLGAYREYAPKLKEQRFHQLEKLKGLLAA
jgi:hypothetical protein